jgi:hypothetical protein
MEKWNGGILEENKLFIDRHTTLWHDSMPQLGRMNQSLFCAVASGTYPDVSLLNEESSCFLERIID